MTDKEAGKVPVTFARGLLDDVAELTTTAAEDDQATKDEAKALKRRIAKLLVECKGNPFIGELMGSGLHSELANCRRVRFDILAYKGKASVSPDLPKQSNRRRPSRVPLADYRPTRRATGSPPRPAALESWITSRAESSPG